MTEGETLDNTCDMCMSTDRPMKLIQWDQWRVLVCSPNCRVGWFRVTARKGIMSHRASDLLRAEPLPYI